MMNRERRLPILAFAGFAALGAWTAAFAQKAGDALPRVEGAWVRSAVPGQQGTGAFMRITAAHDMKLVGASTPAAGVAEVHEMKMDGDVMKMRPVGQLDLPAGRTIELKPGGYHLMLMDLKQALKPGAKMPLTLVFRDAGGAERELQLQVPVATMAPAHGTMDMSGVPSGHAGMEMGKH
jgi:periplasmic copper chaperone A